MLKVRVRVWVSVRVRVTARRSTNLESGYGLG